MSDIEPDPTPDLETAELVLAVQAYLRQDSQLRRAGELPLARQPHWAETALWNQACRAARRLMAWSQPAP